MSITSPNRTSVTYDKDLRALGQQEQTSFAAVKWNFLAAKKMILVAETAMMGVDMMMWQKSEISTPKIMY